MNKPRLTLRPGLSGLGIVIGPETETKMSHAVIRGANGRLHEVDFGDAPVRVEIYSHTKRRAGGDGCSKQFVVCGDERSLLALARQARFPNRSLDVDRGTAILTRSGHLATTLG
jgi:hypothetical protein